MKKIRNTFIAVTLLLINYSFQNKCAVNQIFGAWTYEYVSIHGVKTCINATEAEMEFFKFYFKSDFKYETNGNCLSTIGSGEFKLKGNKLFIKSEISEKEIKEMFLCSNNENCFTKNLYPLKALDKDCSFEIKNDSLLHLTIGIDTIIVFSRIY